MKRRPRPPCPTPLKVAHARHRDMFGGAQAVARELMARRVRPQPIYGYLCPCGRWHLTKRASWDGVPNELVWTAPPELIDWAVTPAGET